MRPAEGKVLDFRGAGKPGFLKLLVFFGSESDFLGSKSDFLLFLGS